MEYWIYNEKTNEYICSVCHTKTEYDYDFCPQCGHRHHATTTVIKYLDELREEEKYLSEKISNYFIKELDILS